MKRFSPEDVPDAHDVAVAVVAVARVLDVEPESVIATQAVANVPSLARWYAFDLLCHGWPNGPRAWLARAVGYRQSQCSKVFRPSKISWEARGDILAAWEALRAGSRPSEVGPAVRELPAFLPHQEGSLEPLEASQEAPLPQTSPPEEASPPETKPAVVELPPANATKARLRAFLAAVVANTGGVKAS